MRAVIRIILPSGRRMRQQWEIQAQRLPGRKQTRRKRRCHRECRKKDSKATWKSGRKLKFTWQEQKDYETIEDDIAALEAKLKELDEKMGSFASDL